MIRAEAIAGLVLLAGALVMIFLVVPAQTEAVADASIQPGTYPAIALWIVAALSALLVVRSVVLLRRTDDSPTPIGLDNVATLLLVGAIVASAFAAMDFLGYIVGGIGLVAALMLYMGVRNPVLLIAVSAGAPAAVWLVFDILLERPLP